MCVLRLTSHDGFFFTLGYGKADSVPGDHLLWSSNSRHDCDWTTAGHYKSILVILIVGMMERGEGRGERRGGREGEGRMGEKEEWGGRMGKRNRREE